MILACGCVVDHGAGWEAVEPDAQGGVSLLLLGDPRPGSTSKRVSEELARALEDEQSAGRTPIVLWMGNHLAPACAEPDREPPPDPWSKSGMRELGAVVADHTRRGGQSIGVMGHRDWRCDLDELKVVDEAGKAAGRWSETVSNAVVRVTVDGSMRVVSTCDADTGSCTIAPPGDGDLLDLVLLDINSWVFPPESGSAKDLRSRTELSKQERLLGSLERFEGPPRVLVSHIPVESAGIHGQGGLRPSATYHRFPPALQRAIAGGTFIGVVSAHERDLEVTADLTHAIQRSSKTWLEAPLFQVTSGASGFPDRHAPGPRTIPGFQGIALHPDLRSSHPGFARVRFDQERVDVVVHAKRGRGWDRGIVSFPIDRPPHPSEIPATHHTPCLRCDPMLGASSGPPRAQERNR
jgi:hypothetical protein